MNAGGGDGSGSTFGGVKGKRGASGTQIAAPKGRLSGAGAGGTSFETPEKENPNYGPRGDGSDQSGGNKIDRGSGATNEASTSLDSLAPLPSRPAMFPVGSEIYRAQIVFTVEINGDVQVSAPASAEAAQ